MSSETLTGQIYNYIQERITAIQQDDPTFNLPTIYAYDLPNDDDLPRDLMSIYVSNGMETDPNYDITEGVLVIESRSPIARIAEDNCDKLRKILNKAQTDSANRTINFIITIQNTTQVETLNDGSYLFVAGFKYNIREKNIQS